MGKRYLASEKLTGTLISVVLRPGLIPVEIQVVVDAEGVAAEGSGKQ